MSNPMDKVPFSNVPQPDDMMNAIQNAQRDPIGFEAQIKQRNPEAYELACKIRNSANPRQAMIQLAQERGVNPNVLRMFGII